MQYKVSLALLALIAVAGPFVSASYAQKQPFLQDIVIPKEEPEPTPTPLVKRTGSSSPTSSVSMRTSIPALAEVDIPGSSGILIESESGSIVLESYSDKAFNPASNVKVATAYAVMKSFGPNFRFVTGVWTDGSVDRETATLNGNLYISGRDPIFGYEHGVAIANELNRLGIRKVEGDIYVTDNFVMNYSGSSQRSGYLLINSIDGAKRNASATNAWNNYLKHTGQYREGMIVPSVMITGGLNIDGLPPSAKLLFNHESAPMREIVKVTLSYSNNFLSERLGDMLGGPKAVARIVRMDTRVPEEDFNLATASGLGINRVTPRAQIELLRKFKSLLGRYRMTFADVMPVAGIDDGTLRNRFNGETERGSVVGKTGTLGRTDGGVSTLSGEITTSRGKFLFVIFNQKGGVRGFRNFQNMFLSLVQDQLGGAKPIGYSAQNMEFRLAQTRIKYPAGSNLGRDE